MFKISDKMRAVLFWAGFCLILAAVSGFYGLIGGHFEGSASAASIIGILGMMFVFAAHDNREV